ncbi:acyl carrier protein [Streptomyces aidingensis]|uniref:Acyl carrier protein n=1 Tax=Streptomyces aidingensis TaxID=910347 RepID=A0A1I1QZ07_9ACTN|nr:phosphopantetheine-binding protein [Streptomyces aidingensis]SFD27364.1 acyl carrier protein [Streptomyces aidingensis]
MSVETPAGTEEERLVAEALAQLLDVDLNQLTTFTVLNTTEGWDSVNQMRVLVYLEREAGGPLDYERFMTAETLGDLAGLVADAAGGELS